MVTMSVERETGFVLAKKVQGSPRVARKGGHMSENDRITDERTEYASDDLEDALDEMSDRINDSVESIAELADDIEEIGAEVKSLLDDLRTLQTRIRQQDKEKLDPLIEQMEGVSKELENAVWTMDCATECLPEEIDVAEILQQPMDCPD
jgi:archaellum component FlaC